MLLNNNQLLPSEVLDAFGNAICQGLIHDVGNLLHEKGEFEIQNQDLEIVSAVKEQFISWLALRRLEYPNANSLSYSTSTCSLCKVNKGIIVFDGGYFPFMAWLKHRVSIAGMALQVNSGKITSVHLCLGFNDKSQVSFFDKHVGEVNEMIAHSGKSELELFQDIFEREYGRSLK